MFEGINAVTNSLNKDILISKLSNGCKPKDEWKIGTEHEKFGFKKKNLRPITFDDIQKIFIDLSIKFSWEKVLENKNIIELRKNFSSITLEPGGQIELSGAPLKNLFETCAEVNQHHDELNEVCKKYEIEFMGMGVLPKWDLSDLKLMPKKRYEIMSNYMPKVGENGLDMMMRTTTIQANFDFSCELDMIKKFRVCQSVQPLIIALYANSPFIGGKLTDYLSFRSQIWTKTDNDRCGLLQFVYEKNFSFERYVDYLLDVPMYFIIRNNKYIDMSGLTFRDYLDGKTKFNDKYEPHIQDWELHITTVFPEVRLKSFLELRGADGGPWSRVCALPAFWTGLLYDEISLEKVYKLIKIWSFKEVENFYKNVRIKGLKTKTPDGINLIDFTKKIIELSSDGLKNRNINKNGKTEDSFLDPLKKILEFGMSPAETWRKLYLNQWSNNLDMLYKNNYFR